MRFSKTSAAALAASAPLALAQTSTSCNPLEKTCPQDQGLNAGTFTSDFTSGSSANASWSAAAYTTINYGSQGAEFTISQAKQAPTIQTDFYIFFGRIDVKMRAAPGTGIISSIVFESDDLDEIDWEFLGGNTTVVETNFFGKGNTTAYDRAIYYPVSTPQTEFHTYTVDWSTERIEWIIDGVTVRTLSANDPLTLGGKNYPQTPMRLKLGSWCGGCEGEPKGTVEWAGGETNFGDAPYTMYVESVNIQNTNPADSYEWTDHSGSWESIKLIDGGSSSSPSGTASASGKTSGATRAPTKSHSVANVEQTGAAVTKTKTGSSYSMNTASASAQNSGSMTSVVGATTQVPGSQPTGTLGGASASASASATGNAAVANGAIVSTSLVGLLFSLLLW